MNNEEEELYCACKGNLCNKDLATISASGDLSSRNAKNLMTVILGTALMLALKNYF